MMNPDSHHSRREFLLTAGGGAGAIALSAMTSPAGWAAETDNPLAARPSHFGPRAKRVIWLFMHGGPSHVDLFDPKPQLIRHAGEPVPESFGPVMTRRDVARNPLMPPVKPFRPRGESGLEITTSCRTSVAMPMTCA